MELLVAILIIAVLGAVAFAVIQRRRGGAAPLGRTHGSPLPTARRGSARSNHPMAAAVEEHAQAVDPHDAAVAEQRLQARAGEVAAGLHATAHRSAAAAHQQAADQYDQPGYAGTAVDGSPAAGAVGYDPASSANYEDPYRDGSIDPVTGERIDGYGDPDNDPRYNDPRYDGRLAADYDPSAPDQRPR